MVGFLFEETEDGFFGLLSRTRNGCVNIGDEILGKSRAFCIHVSKVGRLSSPVGSLGGTPDGVCPLVRLMRATRGRRCGWEEMLASRKRRLLLIEIRGGRAGGGIGRESAARAWAEGVWRGSLIIAIAMIRSGGGLKVGRGSVAVKGRVA